jgi:predicted lipoprotein with Yx(FWY)xxD motif
MKLAQAIRRRSRSTTRFVGPGPAKLAVLLVAVMVLAACGADEPASDTADSAESEAVAVESEPTSTATDAASESSAGGAAEIAVESSDFGDILVDGEGMTLYLFDNDTDENSTCYDDCEANWPPLTGDVTAGEGVDESLLGTSEREDGTTQVTYAGKPLYYFAADQAPGDTNGQAVSDIWWVVGPDGEKITEAAAAADDSGGGAAAGDDDDGTGY